MRHQTTVQLIGNSPAIEDLRQEIERVARSDAKILITGESGSGKEVAARQIYALSSRAERPFVAVNCAGIPESLLESELFGHVRGSFTGAFRDKAGKLEVADEGTIFLDEIGEMTLRMQGLLLRFLETGEIQKVGADGIGLRVNVRTIAATNRNLRDMIAQGLFREDLFYRLNVIHLVVPPLRERKSDIPALCRALSEPVRPHERVARQTLAPAALAVLGEYRWPGNVREMQNVHRADHGARARRDDRLDDMPLKSARISKAASAPPASGGARSPTSSISASPTIGNRSGRRCIRSSCSARSPAAACAIWCGRGLHDARGNYKIVTRMFNMEADDYKKFLNFLRKHDCQPSFKEFR